MNIHFEGVSVKGDKNGLVIRFGDDAALAVKVSVSTWNKFREIMKIADLLKLHP